MCWACAEGVSNRCDPHTIGCFKPASNPQRTMHVVALAAACSTTAATAVVTAAGGSTISACGRWWSLVGQRARQRLLPPPRPLPRPSRRRQLLPQQLPEEQPSHPRPPPQPLRPHSCGCCLRKLRTSQLRVAVGGLLQTPQPHRCCCLSCSKVQAGWRCVAAAASAWRSSLSLSRASITTCCRQHRLIRIRQFACATQAGVHGAHHGASCGAQLVGALHEQAVSALSGLTLVARMLCVCDG